MRPFIVISSVIAMGFPMPGLALPESDDMRVMAVAYDAIPEGAAFRLRTREDRELDHQIQREIAAALTSRGYAVHPDAPFVIDIEAEIDRTPAYEYGGMGELDIGSGGVEIRVNLWSSNENSLLRRQRNPDPLPDREFRISLAIHGAEHQGHICRYLWRGVAADLWQTGSPAIASREMIPALVDLIGQTATIPVVAAR